MCAAQANIMTTHFLDEQLWRDPGTVLMRTPALHRVAADQTGQCLLTVGMSTPASTSSPSGSSQLN
jgi:hypothetical protein